MRAKVWFSSKTHFRQRSPIRMPRIGALRLSFSKHKASSAFLRKPRDEQNVFGNACNNVANARKFFVGLATLLQTLESFSWDLQQCCKRQKIFRGTCNGVANARKFFVRLATVLQTLKSSSGHLQHSCKHQKILRGICSIPANTKKSFEAFAAFLQTPKNSSRHLQHSCKHQKVFRGICSVPANAKKFFGALAALLQTFPKTLWPLERSIKDMLQGQQTSFFRRTRVAYRMGAVVRQEYPTCPKVFLSKKGRRLVRAL